MNKFLALLVLIIAAFVPTQAQARERYFNYCQEGNQPAFVANIQITTPLQRTFPGCTVQVNQTGTATPATIYSDPSGTPLANPFTADMSTGFFEFYADNGTYDLLFSGGEIVTPYTWAGVSVIDPINVPNVLNYVPSVGTLAQQCATAATAKLYLAISVPITGVLTGSCAANVAFLVGGSVQPANGELFTFSAGVVAAPTLKIFDISAGGADILTKNCCAAIYPGWWGAVPDDTVDSTTAMQAAINASIASQITLNPCGGTYKITGNLTLTSVNTNLIVEGCGVNTELGSSDGTRWHFTAGGLVLAGVRGVVFQDFGIYSAVTAGDSITITGGSGRMSFRHMVVRSDNPAKSLVNASPNPTGTGGDLDLINFEDIEWQPAATYTQWPLWFHVGASGGPITPVRIVGDLSTELIGRTDATVPFILVDCGTSQCRGWTFQNLQSEATSAGFGNFIGLSDSVFDNVLVADAAPVTAPQLQFSTNPGGTAPTGIVLINPYVADGTDDIITPSLLVDLTNNGSPRAPGIEAIGGTISFGRIINNTQGSTIKVRNTVVASGKDFSVSQNASTMPPDGLAQGESLSASTANGFGRIGLMTKSNSSVSSANCLFGTSLVVDPDDPNLVGASGATPNVSDIGSYLEIYSGTGLIAIPHLIIGVNTGTNQWILQTAAGSVGASGGNYSVSRGLIGMERDRQVPSNGSDWIVACTANSDTTVSRKQMPQIIGPTTFAQLPAVTMPLFAIITDSNTVTWGANIAGGSSSRVLAWWNGSNWTVFGK